MHTFKLPLTNFLILKTSCLEAIFSIKMTPLKREARDSGDEGSPKRIKKEYDETEIEKED